MSISDLNSNSGINKFNLPDGFWFDDISIQSDLSRYSHIVISIFTLLIFFIYIIQQQTSNISWNGTWKWIIKCQIFPPSSSSCDWCLQIVCVKNTPVRVTVSHYSCVQISDCDRSSDNDITSNKFLYTHVISMRVIYYNNYLCTC